MMKCTKTPTTSPVNTIPAEFIAKAQEANAWLNNSWGILWNAELNDIGVVPKGTGGTVTINDDYYEASRFLDNNKSFLKKRGDTGYSCYAAKQDLEDKIDGLYLTNGQLILMMHEHGYRVWPIMTNTENRRNPNALIGCRPPL